MSEEKMLEFRKYPAPPPGEVDPPICVVSYPEACGRGAVGEVWSLPFCEAHGGEAVAAARLEAVGDAERELSGLLANDYGRIVDNVLTRQALAAVSFSGIAPARDHEEAIAAAYALDRADTDPDTLAYDYEEIGEGPYDWWCEARELTVKWMREAYESCQSPLLKALEPLRERASVQQVLAHRDMERRWVAPRRAERERRRRDARRDPSTEILRRANTNLAASVEVLEELPADGPADVEAIRQAVIAIAEGGQIVARESARVSRLDRPAE